MSNQRIDEIAKEIWVRNLIGLDFLTQQALVMQSCMPELTKPKELCVFQRACVFSERRCADVNMTRNTSYKIL